jgi:DNA-directed RNA polymerase sigma subunit (sigma70/sigma32)
VSGDPKEEEDDGFAMSLREVGKALGISRMTVLREERRALKKLKRCSFLRDFVGHEFSGETI